MAYSFDLTKMRSNLNGGEVEYFVATADGELRMNDLLGQPVELRFRGEIHCKSCGILTRKSFAQGFCYNCFLTSPEAEECVLNPEKCKAHLGVARDIEYSRTHCLIPHYVYLSVTSGLKVGVTRHTQIPTRWIDQGATRALILAETPNRHIAGLMEVFLKQHYSDKTQWSKMLMGDDDGGVDLMAEKGKAASLLPAAMKRLVSPHDQITRIQYPVLRYPEKPINIDLQKNATVSGVLNGIKGQYLMVGDSVINIRRHTGFGVLLSF